MVKINGRLFPIKAHYFFFMAAMGPILPQLFVLGKDIGISAELMGYILSILPVMYVIAKPIFGFIADYFVIFRKCFFIMLIVVMTLAFAALYFVPDVGAHKIQATNNWNLTFYSEKISKCDMQNLREMPLCMATRSANCYEENGRSFNAYLVDILTKPVTSLNFSNNIENHDFLHLCLGDEDAFKDPTQQQQQQQIAMNASCVIEEGVDTECLFRSSAFWLYTVFVFLGTVGFNVTNSISDAICFDMLGNKEDKYGAQRVWGTIGFGLTALLAGLVVNVWTDGAVKSFTPALVIMLIFSGFDLLSVSKLKLPKLSSSESIVKDVWQLVTHPAIAIFLVFAVISGILDAFIIYFMFWHVEQVAEETGYMDQIKLIEGCIVAAECLAAEIPFFFYSGKIIKKIGYVHCMSLCFFFYAIRLYLISWIPNPWYLVGVEFFFQGCTYALCYTCVVAYASAIAPPGTSATVQGLVAGMDDGLGYSIGSLIGGVALKRFGGRASFLYFSIMALCTCVAHIIVRPFSYKKQYLPKADYVAAATTPQQQAPSATTVKDFEMEKLNGSS